MIKVILITVVLFSFTSCGNKNAIEDNSFINGKVSSAKDSSISSEPLKKVA